MSFQYVSPPPVEYTVTTEFSSGELVVVYHGAEINRALRSTSFWDEIQSTWLIETRLPMDPLSVAMRKFDQLEEYIRTKP